MPYSLTPADLKTITDVDCAFGATKLLPALDDIPAEFKSHSGNLYTKLADALFFGRKLPECDIQMNPGFEDCVADLRRCVGAHLASFEPKHEHKIAGVAYMISKMCSLTATPSPAPKTSQAMTP